MWAAGGLIESPPTPFVPRRRLVWIHTVVRYVWDVVGSELDHGQRRPTVTQGPDGIIAVRAARRIVKVMGDDLPHELGIVLESPLLESYRELKREAGD